MITVILYMVLAVLTVFLAIAIYNAFTAPMLRKQPPNAQNLDATSPFLLPRVSVLIPARNEEQNIGNCLTALVEQSYKNLEILVLNDHSTDGTAGIVQEFMRQHTNIKLLNGITIPPNWLGKTWACQQLSSAATGDVLIFTDADNTHAPNAVANSVAWLMKYQLGMLSAFPQQQTVSMTEQLVVPVMDMFVYAGLPLWLTYKSEHTSLSAANGQWIAFNKDAYTLIGGHVTVRNQIVEDVELARIMKQRGIKILTMTGTEAVFCRMYHSFDEVWAGFTKNIFGLVRYNSESFFALMGLLFFVCIVPYFTVWFESFRWLSLAAIVMNMLMRLILSLKFKHPLLTSVFLHPAGMALTIAIGINSYIQVQRGTIQWKDRDIDIKAAMNRE